MDDSPAESASSAKVSKPIVFFSKGDKDTLVATDPKFPFSLRTTRAQWVHEKKEAITPIVTDGKGQSTKSGPPIIVFMLGGLSFSEMRVAYEITKEWNRDVYIGNSQYLMM